MANSGARAKNRTELCKYDLDGAGLEDALVEQGTACNPVADFSRPSQFARMLSRRPTHHDFLCAKADLFEGGRERYRSRFYSVGKHARGVRRGRFCVSEARPPFSFGR